MRKEENDLIHRGTYDGTIYHNPANKFCIISVKTTDKDVPQEARSIGILKISGHSYIRRHPPRFQRACTVWHTYPLDFYRKWYEHGRDFASHDPLVLP